MACMWGVAWRTLLAALTVVESFDFGSVGGCSNYDDHGCCASDGFFWCGSSGRCTFGDDACEDGGGAYMGPCTMTSGGASFDLSLLRFSTEAMDHVTVDSASTAAATTTFVFNVCGNAVTPDACSATSGESGGEVLNGAAPAFALFSDGAAAAAAGSGGGISGSPTGRFGGPTSMADVTCVRLGASASVQRDGVASMGECLSVLGRPWFLSPRAQCSAAGNPQSTPLRRRRCDMLSEAH